MILLLLLVMIVAWVLLTAIIICINTKQNEYYIWLKSIAKASIDSSNGNIIFSLKTPVGKFKFDPFTLGEFTCVPVVKVGMGFGSGGGTGNPDIYHHSPPTQVISLLLIST